MGVMDRKPCGCRHFERCFQCETEKRQEEIEFRRDDRIARHPEGPSEEYKLKRGYKRELHPDDERWLDLAEAQFR